jgi:hypothetical protein
VSQDRTGAAGTPAPAVPQPLEIRRAMLGIYVVSVCYALLAVFAILTRDAAEVAARDSDTNLTDAEITSAVNALVLIAVVVGIGVAVVGIIAAINLARGRRWARVAATIVIAVALLFSLLGLLGSGAVAVAVHTIVILSGAGALYFLYRRVASEFLGVASRR